MEILISNMATPYLFPVWPEIVFSRVILGEGHRKPKKKDYGHRKPLAVTESQFEKARSQKATFGFTKKPI